MEPGSGTPAGAAISVAENVLLTECAEAKLANTAWNETLNCAVKFADHTLEPSALTPDMAKVAVAAGPPFSPPLLFTKLNGELGGPATVHICPTAAGDAVHPALPLIPWKTLLIISAGNPVLAAKLIKGNGGAKVVLFAGSVALFKF